MLELLSSEAAWTILIIALTLLIAMRRSVKGFKPQSPPFVSQLFVYPIKSCRGVSVKSLEFDRSGFKDDRRWMVASFSEDKKDLSMITQRQAPKMALIQPGFSADGRSLELSAPGMPTLTVAKSAPESSTVHELSIWKNRVKARVYGPDAADWLTKYLGMPAVLLGYLGDEKHVRPIAAQWDRTNKEHRIAPVFADELPFLVATDASLRALNARLPEDDRVSMRNFRPNIVISNVDKAFDEDYWEIISIARDYEFDVCKPCGRCSIPQVNPDNGQRSKTNEPRQTLTKLHGIATKPYFGVLVSQRQPAGRVSCGDLVRVVRRSRENGLLSYRKLKEREAKEKGVDLATIVEDD